MVDQTLVLVAVIAATPPTITALGAAWATRHGVKKVQASVEDVAKKVDAGVAKIDEVAVVVKNGKGTP